MKPGDRVGDRFVLDREIGSGGMSTVYLGHDEVLDRKVAVKVLRPGFKGSDAGSRFEREGRTAARLSHANVVQVYDAGDAEVGNRHIFYIVMECVGGGNLKDLMDSKAIPEDELASIGAEVAAGLAHAHERGIVHRDIKPQNVLMDEHGTPKLTDFGIARALVDGTTSSGISLTRTHGGYLGTALYSSPEQLHGKSVTFKSDVYSLGVTLYHAAVGEPPFSGAPIEVAAQQMVRDPEPPRMRGAAIGDEMEKVILLCMSRDPARRPDAATLGSRLAAISSERGVTGRLKRKVPATGPSGASPADRMVLTGAAVIAVVLILFVGAMLFMQDQASRPSGSGQDTPRNNGSGAQSDQPGRGGQSGQPAQSGPSGDGSSDGQLTGDSAAATVANMYVATTVQDDFERGYGFLSDGFRRESYPRLEDWVGENEDLEALTFTGTPTAEVSGQTAVVRGEVMVIRGGVVEAGSGEWDMVAEDGEWKVDGIDLRTTRANGGATEA